MKNKYWILAIGALVIAAGFAMAGERREEHVNVRVTVEPRNKGIAQHGIEHHVTRNGETVKIQVYRENRSITEIRRDPHIIHFSHVGWHPVNHWDHWYRADWGVFWRLTDWSTVRTVTCEAVNTQTELLYPATETRVDSWFWTADLVNNVAARALDDCAAESGNPDSCALVQGECWNSIY